MACPSKRRSPTSNMLKGERDRAGLHGGAPAWYSPFPNSARVGMLGRGSGARPAMVEVSISRILRGWFLRNAWARPMQVPRSSRIQEGKILGDHMFRSGLRGAPCNIFSWRIKVGAPVRSNQRMMAAAYHGGHRIIGFECYREPRH